MAELKDSGNRQEFSTGAVRDIQEGKGRCDLLPLDTLAQYYEFLQDDNTASILTQLYLYQQNKNSQHAFAAIRRFGEANWFFNETMFLDISKHFEDGAVKYGENNWRKGIPCDRYIDSAVRHFLKHIRGDDDEPHDRAFVWNILCSVWTLQHLGWNLERVGGTQ